MFPPETVENNNFHNIKDFLFDIAVYVCSQVLFCSPRRFPNAAPKLSRKFTYTYAVANFEGRAGGARHHSTKTSVYVIGTPFDL